MPNDILHIEKPKFDKLPPTLSKCKTLHLWKKGLDKNGRPKKIPCDLYGHNRDPFDPNLYVDIREATKRIEAISGKYGIAVTLGHDGLSIEVGDSKRYLWCFDFDGFMHMTNLEIDTDADTLCQRLQTYTEDSDSSTGLKSYFWSDKPPCTKFDIKFGDSPYAPAFPDIRKYTDRKIEVFSMNRFLALSGSRSFPLFTELRFLSAQDVDAILDEADMLAKASGGSGSTKLPPTTLSRLTSTPTVTPKTYAKPLREDMAKVLLYVDAEDEQVWSDTFNGIARTYDEVGRCLVHDYSKRSVKYDETECDARYDRALLEVIQRPEGYTAKHIIEVARQHPEWPKDFEIRYENPFSASADGVFVTPTVAAGISVNARGDVANAQRYVVAAGGRMHWVYEIGSWISWNTNKWQPCTAGEEMALAKHVAMAMVTEAAGVMATDQERGNRLMREAMLAQTLPRLNAMIEIAKSETGVTVAANRLDTDPMMLGVVNGVVELRTGALLAGDPKMLITKSCNARYDRTAKCPIWLQFLADIFPGDPDTIETVQRALGYTLTGLNTEEVLFICLGYGNNGKSVFGNVVHRLLGDYAKTTNGSLLVARRSGDNSPRDDIAGLAGCRYVGINETQAGDRLDEQGVKMIAGREPITARYLYGSNFTFVPQLTPWLRTNHKPRIHGTDDGIWRRLVIVPFNRKFTEEERDPQLEQKLMAEQDGILAWMVDGALKYQHNGGLKLSTTIKREGQEYRTESDFIGQFLDESTEKAAGEHVEQVILYKRWTVWCGENGIHPATKHSFSRRLKERGHEEKRVSSKRYYTGLKLMTGLNL